MKIRSLVAPLAALAFLGPSPAGAAEDSGAPGAALEQASRQAFDLVLLRPLQTIQVVTYAAVFVPAYPLSLLFDAGDDVLDLCITEPIERLTRPIGEL